MRDSDDLPYVVIERHSGGLGAFLWGAMIGAGAALLLAPRSGSETQEDLRASVRRVRTAAEDRVETARSTVNRTRSRLEDQLGNVREQISSVREQIDSKAERARETLESGRRAAMDARADIERRVAEAKESYGARLERAGRGDIDAQVGEVDVVLSDNTDDEGRPDIG